MDSSADTMSPEAALAALAWQIELGADEAIGDRPVNRYELPARQAGAEAQKRAPAPSAAPAPSSAPAPGAEAMAGAGCDPTADPVAEAERLAAAAGTLEDLRAAIAAFEHCELKRGARSLVFADGNPAARVMVIGEAPGRDEDREGRPFVGRAGRLLDRMFAAIGLSRTAPDPEHALYITNILPWRPPQNRDPSPEEIAMMRPFVLRHIDLVAPDVIVLMGNIACQALLGQRGITRLRGHWQELGRRPVRPMFHPAYLLRNPAAKREAWADLLALGSRLKTLEEPDGQD